MKRGGNFLLLSRGEQKGRGGVQLTFYSIFNGGKKYAGRYVAGGNQRSYVLKQTCSI